ncbi:D-sedoheptulose-7-phosphate isomerase [Methylacidiphilum caldifontis]|uniref:Phosphoheptose isomerase n=1 Tax=Methylacidiphilum caldifontis TaxID=2795386 RepID=A0A4Y8PCN8_9BACT|nr:SIS domain-containing protein [Methylacidiphilum caldifontis]QSR88521.1 SIS domain-containing protein [Methylacidiphilum caldifontis]TFE69048.1 phosphoheptose isomerase [Methylacidiphilum caldifontis]
MDNIAVNSSQIIGKELAELCDLTTKLQKTTSVLLNIAERILHCFEQDKKILCAGNGGSAAQAMHFVEELVGKFRNERRPLGALSLVSDGPTLSCIANDFGYDEVFSRQIEALGNVDDLLILFSTSGASRNLVRAVHTAKNLGMFSVAFLGKGGGELAHQVDLAWIVPSESTSRIQEMHCWATHVLLEIVEEWVTFQQKIK